MTDPTTSAPERIGFVGLGVMGTPMVGHLASAGYPVTVFDLDRSASDRVAATNSGVLVGSSVGDVAHHSDIVFTMLPDGQVVNQVVTSSDGLISGLEAGSLVVDTSSSQPWLTLATADALAERGVAMVDAPVSGAQWGAEAAELVFMVGGSAEDVARARPLLDVLGRAAFHLGPLGSGHVMKSVNNTVTAITLQATLEGLAVGVAAGLDPEVMNAVFNESTAGSWLTRTHISQRIVSRTFDDPFRLGLMRKDVEIAERMAQDQSLDLRLIPVTADSYREADQQRGAGSSISELALWLESVIGRQLT